MFWGAHAPSRAGFDASPKRTLAAPNGRTPLGTEKGARLDMSDDGGDDNGGGDDGGDEGD